jgi:hypothetical protein
MVGYLTLAGGTIITSKTGFSTIIKYAGEGTYVLTPVKIAMWISCRGGHPRNVPEGLYFQKNGTTL